MEGVGLDPCLRTTPRRARATGGCRRPTADRAAGAPVRLARLRDLALVPAIMVIGMVGYIVNPVFLTSDNLINVLQTMSEIALLVLAQTLDADRGQDGPLAGVHLRPRAGRRRLADRRRRRRPTDSGCCPGRAIPVMPAGRRAHRR